MAPRPTSTPFPHGHPVRLEVRHGSSRPVTYDVTGEEFLVGSVPGCDLRLPGSNIPPNVCLIRRSAGEVWLRRLAPSLPILINGKAIPAAGQVVLKHNDIVSIGAVDVTVSLHQLIDRKSVV